MYVKAPKEFVEYLAVEHGYDHRYDTSRDRQIFADGNYLLWDRDFLPVCSSENIMTVLPSLGCVALTAPQVRAEQDETVVNELPEITDERLLAFIAKRSEQSQTPEPDPEQPKQSEPTAEPDTPEDAPLPDETEGGDA